MSIKLQINKGKVPVKIWTEDIDPAAIQQLINISQLDIVKHHIAAMPDVHAGIGATVGSVIPTVNAVIPASVGVDIGCGMNAIRLSLSAQALPDSLLRLRSAIERAVPVGFKQHERSKIKGSAHQRQGRYLSDRLDAIIGKHPGIVKMQKHFNKTWLCQLGTLGGGNHFIELCLDENDGVWLMLHSGSRGIGNVIGRYFINKAQKDMRGHGSHLPDLDLAYFKEGNPHFDDYIEAVMWAQDYAMENRRMMMGLILEAIRPHLPKFQLLDEAINCHHNYIGREQHFNSSVYITRKGAISAQLGELGIIPGSMGAKSHIVRGLGNQESFCSCAHGAGRTMSRMEAKRRFNVLDLAAQTEGIECRKDRGVIDEIPAAYKDIDSVMANQNDLVEVIHTLKQVLCVKG